MIRNRKIISIIFTILMLFSLTACGTKQQGEDIGGQNGSQLPSPVATASPIPDKPSETAAVPEPSEGGQTEEPSATPAEADQGKATATPDTAVETPGSPAPSEKPEDKPLKGKIICVDPGHQSEMKKGDVPVAPGSDIMMPDFAIGTKGVSTGVFEYTVVLDVSKKLKKALEDLGAEVVLTRNAPDEAVSNIERAQIANDAHADIFVRIHCDGSETQEAKGISVLYPGSKYIKDKAMLDESLALSKSILEGAVRATQAKNRGLSERNDLIGFNYSKVPSTLIEMGFMTNPDEDKLLNSESYQSKLVQGIVDGIIKYFKQE